MEAVTDATFESLVLHAQKPVVVDFWAPWCGPCRRLAPILEEVATELGDTVTILKLNTDENMDTASKYQIMSIPTLIFFKNGVEVGRSIGSVSDKELLKERITSAFR